MKEINLLSIPFLDVNYSNVIDFKSPTDRSNYFNGLSSKVVSLNLKYDTLRSEIVLPITLKECENYDYLYYWDSQGFPLFYFIVGKEYETKENTKLMIKLDVFTTYQFDVELLSSFVDRMHVDRWSNGVPTKEWTDEGIEIGEYEIGGKYNIYKLQNNCIYTANTPLGKMASGTGGGGTDPGSGNTITNECGDFTIPTYGTITATFPQYSDGSFHGGVDFGNTLGTPIYAPQSGIVVSTSLDSRYGIHSVIEHSLSNGKCYSILAHLSYQSISVGSNVNRGQQIGTMGSTGNSTGNHLHWEVRKTSYSNSSFCIQPLPGYTVGDTINKPVKEGELND